MSNKKRFEESHYILKELTTSSSSTIYLSLPKTAADEILLSFSKSSRTPEDRNGAIASLKERCCAAKVCNSSKYSAVLGHEIATLQLLSRHNHPNLVQFLNADVDGNWFTMPLYPGGSLEDLTHVLWRLENPALPSAFVWHVTLQLASALLFLHFGISTDGTKQEDWPLLLHGDMHGGNVLFSDLDEMPERTRTYPNVVLADFGKARRFADDDGGGSKPRDDFLHLQMKDITNLAVYLERLGNRTEDESFRNAVTGLLEVEQAKKGADKNRDARRVLLRLVKDARKKRDKMYEPLPRELEELFRRPVISNIELAERFDIFQSAEGVKDSPSPDHQDAETAVTTGRRGCCTSL